MKALRIATVIVLASVPACSDEDGRSSVTGFEPDPDASVNAVSGDGIAIPAIVDLLGDITEIRSDAAIRRGLHLTDAELVSAIRDAAGRAYVAFKPTAAQHTTTTGVFPAMSREFALSARSDIIALGPRLIRTFPTSATIVVEMAPDLAPTLRQLPFVNYVEPVREAAISSQDTAWGVKKIGAPTVWTDYGNHGEYSTISFLDTGIDETHAGIELWATGNCYYDSVYFNSCFDDHGHGSHVIGIATARSNSTGMIGVAYWPSRLASFKVCDFITVCYDDAVASALYFLETVGWPRHTISMSFGGPSIATEVAQSVARLYDAGVLLVAAAGNNPNAWGYTGVLEPARFPEVIAVSGTLENDGFADYPYFCVRDLSPDYTTGSNSGPEVEISAPFHARSTVLNGQFDNECGTSMATPHVSATAALVWSQNTAFSNVQVRSRLATTAVDLGAGGRDVLFGYGRVNAAAAAEPPPPAPPMTVTITGPSTGPSYQQVTVQALVSNGTPPFTYAWQRDGSPACGNQNWCAGNPSVYFYVTVTDSDGDQASDYHVVTAQ